MGEGGGGRGVRDRKGVEEGEVIQSRNGCSDLRAQRLGRRSLQASWELKEKTLGPHTPC